MPESGYHDHLRPELLRHFPQGARRLLDVGCGEGALSLGLDDLQSRELWGIELDAAAAQVAASRLDKVLVGDAAALVNELPDAHFDCVFCNDILEHLVWPEEFLLTLATKLAPGGTLISSVPNVRHFWTVVDLVMKGRWDYADEGILDRTHLRFYTRATMREMFERTGYQVDSVEGLNPLGSARFKLFNLATLGFFREMGFLQYVWVLRRGS